VLADTLVRLLRAPEIVLCDFALREGLVLEYAARNQRKIARADRYPDIRRRSVIELGDRCRWNFEHAQQVARLTLSLFDQTRPIHRLGDRAREWLEFAALLHDTGAHISYTRHHKHSEYLIRNGGLRGFEPAEIQAIALVARYHRRAAPKKSHEGFGTLAAGPRRFVRVGSALLRLAECLDRSHAQLVERIEWIDEHKAGRLRVFSKGEAELEMWAANHQKEPLERALDREIAFETADAHARHTDQPAQRPGSPVRRRGHRRLRRDQTDRPARRSSTGGDRPAIGRT
jgi:exopolyphosphatase/guanosine-5'-triphosphate,3'-diphosphate pyrophosphatase